MTNRPTVAVAALLLVLAVIAGCGLFTAQQPGSAAARDLAAHLDAWRASGPSSYSYTITRSCFCPFTDPLRVTVTNGVTTAITKAGQPAAAEELSFLPKTVPEAFKVVSDNLAAAKIAVTYDPTFGFPTSIVVDSIANAIDDEFSMTLTDFAPAP